MLRTQRMISMLWLIPGILFLAYFLFLQSLYVDFALVWLAAAAACFAAAFFHYLHLAKGWQLPGWLKLLLIACLVLGGLVFAGAQLLIAGKMNSRGEPDLDYIVVLGAQVKHDRPSRALKKRIDTACKYLKENPDTRAVLSGGQGSGEYITEAECMRRVLTEYGIEPSRLILEEASTSTKENLIFSARLAPLKEKRTGLVTQNFHVYRSLKLADHQGYERVCGIAAPSEWIYQPHFLVREGFALIKEKLVGNIE